MNSARTIKVVHLQAQHVGLVNMVGMHPIGAHGCPSKFVEAGVDVIEHHVEAAAQLGPRCTRLRVLQEIKRQLHDEGIDRDNLTILAEERTSYQDLVNVIDTARSFRTVVAASVVDAELFRRNWKSRSVKRS